MPLKYIVRYGTQATPLEAAKAVHKALESRTSPPDTAFISQWPPPLLFFEVFSGFFFRWSVKRRFLFLFPNAVSLESGRALTLFATGATIPPLKYGARPGVWQNQNRCAPTRPWRIGRGVFPQETVKQDQDGRFKKMKEMGIAGGFIELHKLLKFENWVASGGEAKYVIADGLVMVNGEVETRKRKKIFPGDVIEFGDEKIRVAAGQPSGAGDFKKS